MNKQAMTSKIAILLGATALSLPTFGLAQEDDCATLDDGQLRAGCAQLNAGVVMTGPVPPNTEDRVAPSVNNSGFSLSIDGVAVNADPRITNQIRRTDIALAQANVQVSFDELNPIARLNVETVGAPRAYRAGDRLVLKSEMNYPALVTRGEMRIIDRGAAGGPRLLGVVPIALNGTAAVTVPDGQDIVIVHRVIDSRGRYDETEPLPISRPDDRGLTASIEEGVDFTAVRNIPIRGGAVTVAATQVSPDAIMSTLGERVRPDREGKLVIQRILPAGAYGIDVAITGAGTRAVELTRDIDIPRADWFLFGLADVTIGRFEDGQSGETEIRKTGRLRYYVDGQTDGGVQITSSLDTGEDELDQLFRRLDEKDPRSVLGRLDTEDTFPTFGDDSSSTDNTPTSGKIYLRVERDDDFFVWGDYRAALTGSTYLRNERTLYGAQAEYNAPASTEEGEPRASISLYAAQPDQLVGREVFRGTGGSVYFLRRQDITVGTETLTVELRDSDTGRVVERQSLVAGRDYTINYVQGYITLTTPLSSGGNTNLIQTNPGGDLNANLIAQYEYTPTALDVDGYAYGGRVEGWVTDDVRVGITGQSDTTGTTDQTAVGVDLRYHFGDNSFVQLDYAETDGPGFDVSFSTDGGLFIDEQAATAGTGRAARIKGQADLADLDFGRTGVISGYYEDRTAGFNTLDYAVTEDEILYGARVVVEADERLGWTIYGDRRDSDDGTQKTEIGAEVNGRLSESVSLAFAAETLDQTTPEASGQRITVGAELDYAASDTLSYQLFGQSTVDNSGLGEYNRIGIGAERKFTNGWAITAELSEGTGGIGGRILAERSRDNNA
ncbi:hypothetical protein QTO30_18555 [Yoonia sp. GPGPB17]|uniref:hypothetical protein n=1 Tax=Yoonia sp. GPGPB17 TaxID=3026147 RepID=UPI0030C5FFE1